MIKRIILGGEQKDMTIEEAFNQFEKFLYKLAKKYSQYELDDMFSIAKVGFMKAYNGYDYKKGNTFITYLGCCVNSELNMYCRKNKRNNTVSLQEVAFMDDKEGILYEDMLTEEKSNIDIFLEDEAFRTDMKIALDTVKGMEGRYFEIIKDRYINDLSQMETARKHGISQPQVSRAETKALKRCRRILNSN